MSQAAIITMVCVDDGDTGSWRWIQVDGYEDADVGEDARLG